MFAKYLFTALCLGLVVAATPADGLTVHSGYQATQLYSSAGTFTVIGGLDCHDGELYFGQSTEINSLDLSDLTSTKVGDVSSIAGNSFVTVKPDTGVVYTSYGTSYDFPYPYTAGYLDTSGAFVAQLNMDGIYDAAVNSVGQLFIVANPGADGSFIYEYDWSNGSTRTVANVGGWSGGLAFDADDNLYYAADTGRVVRFDAADVAAGDLTMADAATALELASPGYLAFDDDGNLFATNYDGGTKLNLYDLDTQTKIADVADGGGKMVWTNGVLYTIDTTWGMDSFSTIEAITAVPEPGTLALLAMLGVMLVGRRARRSA
ncbi:MAG: PEP-CTERM sorting domain-containing protein [Pirellulales bacterium]|nr:PEP-CTERM sorting domain-containing protein [Pirellulales bacterium]